MHSFSDNKLKNTQKTIFKGTENLFDNYTARDLYCIDQNNYFEMANEVIIIIPRSIFELEKIL